MKNYEILKKMFLFLAFLCSISLNIAAQESEEGDAMVESYKWYYGQRKYPLDNIPADAYQNAVNQSAVLKSTGFNNSTSNWVNVGPKPLVYETAGPTIVYSGRVNNVVYDPRDIQLGQTLYITGAEGGVFKTINGGNNWIDINGDLPTLSAGALTLDAQNNILYFGTGDPYIYYGSEKGTGLYKTTDEQHWTKISNNIFPDRTTIYRIAINPLNHNNIFVAEATGLYETLDGGSSWFKPSEIYLPGVCSDVCFSPNGLYIYAIGPSPNFDPNIPPMNGIGFWRSYNGGQFQQIGSGTGFPHLDGIPFGRSCLAVSKADANRLYILSYDNIWPDRAYVYYSQNNGDRFSSYTNALWDMGFNAGYNMVIRCSDNNPQVCLMGLKDLYFTNNGGQSWSGGENSHPDCHAIDFNPHPNYPNQYTVGNDGGVWRADAIGENMTSLNQDLSLSEIYSVSSSAYLPNYMLGGFQDYGHGYNFNTGNIWHCIPATGGDGTKSLFSLFRSIFVTGSRIICRDLFYSTNITFSFLEASNYFCQQGGDCHGLSSNPSTITYFIAPIVNHPTQPGVEYTVRYPDLNTNGFYTPIYIFKSTDYGANWNDVSNLTVQISNPNQYVAPTLFAISPSNPNTMIMDEGNGSEFWQYHENAVSRLYKSVDGGQSWNLNSPILQGGTNGIPNYFFTHIEFEPTNENEIYLTMSGYNPSEPNHVFRTLDGGVTWSSIQGNLPNCPVNDLIIHYTGSPVNGNIPKEIIVATDVGVFRTDAYNINWNHLAEGLPNNSIVDLDYNRLSGRLKCSSFGRGIYETQLNGPIYIPDNVYITDDINLSQQLIVCSGGTLTLGHSKVPDIFYIGFNQPENVPNIIVQNGGQIIATSGNPIHITSNTSNVIGIEFESGSYGHFTNCSFENINNAINIDYSSGGDWPIGGQYLSIDGCQFSNSSVTVNGDCGIPVYIQNSSFTGCGANMNSAIQINYNNNVLTFGNYILNAASGIIQSNSNSEITSNTITSNYSYYLTDGISLDNCTNPSIRYNNISRFVNGINLNNSSPKLLVNNISDCNSCVYLNSGWSLPQLCPTSPGDGSTIWDGGVNDIYPQPSGIGIRINSGYPFVDQGVNLIHGGYFYMDMLWYAQTPFLMTKNCWDGGEPNPYKFFPPALHGEIIWDPIECTSPFSNVLEEKNINKEIFPDYMAGGQNNVRTILDPQQPYIIDLGHGHFDTIKVTSGNLNLNQCEVLYSAGIKQELNNNFVGALNTYKQIVQNYHDSLTSIKAVISMLSCVDKIINDSVKYNSLENYYLNVIQTYPSDTMLCKVSNELAHKTLVRKGQYSTAITAYENDIQNTTDTLEILCYQLNIVETYMLFNQNSGGNSVQFTGTHKELKPKSKQDGFRMIAELLNHKKLHVQEHVIPNEFKLSQNYPNPFNPTTKIDYQLPKAEKVVIKVYDILGKLVKELVNEQKDAGYYTVTFDGTNFASGVYFYRINAGSFNAVKKMVLVK